MSRSPTIQHRGVSSMTPISSYLPLIYTTTLVRSWLTGQHWYCSSVLFSFIKMFELNYLSLQHPNRHFFVLVTRFKLKKGYRDFILPDPTGSKPFFPLSKKEVLECCCSYVGRNFFLLSASSMTAPPNTWHGSHWWARRWRLCLLLLIGKCNLFFFSI